MTTTSLYRKHTININKPFGNFLPIKPISSPPTTEPCTGFIHQISGFPGGAAKSQIIMFKFMYTYVQ